jgi:hypothetical protein
MYALSFAFRFTVAILLYLGVMYVITHLSSADDPSKTTDDHPHD